MIQNLQNIPSRTTETNTSGIIKDSGKEAGEGKENLFKQLFERLQNSEEKGETSNKPEGKIKKEEAKDTESEKSSVKKESATNGSEKNADTELTAAKSDEAEGSADKSNASAKNDQTISTQTSDDVTVKQNAADEKIADQKGSLSLKDEPILKTGSKREAEQQANRAGSESSESKSANNEGQILEGTNREKRVVAPTAIPAQQGENVPPESGLQYTRRPGELTNNQMDSAVRNDQGSKNSKTGNVASSLNAQSTGETISTGSESAESGNSEAENVPSIPKQESQGLTSSTETGPAEEFRPSEGSKINFEKMSSSSQELSGQIKTQSGSEEQAAGASQVRLNSEPASFTQGFESTKAVIDTISSPEQVAKMPSELGGAFENTKHAMSDNMLRENESGSRIDTHQRDTGSIIARMVMGQMQGGELSAGSNTQMPQAAELTRNAQAFVKANGQMTDANRAPEPALIREELQKGSLNKPEVFSISSDIKKVFNQKNKSQDERGRLDVDKISMRAGESNRAPVLDMENLQFGSNGQQSMKWDMTAGSLSSSDKAEDSFTFKKFTPEFTASKEVEATDQKNTNYTSLASVTISNISVKRNVLPGLTQIALRSGSGQGSPESWNKHSFVLEDGSKIQLSSRKLDGVIQLKIGSTTPELNRLLLQHQNEILEHLKKESELEVDLQFDTPKEESGFESFDDQKPAQNTPISENQISTKQNPTGPRGYAASRSIRSFGYNKMEWTA